jgi:beta-galactosidase
MDFSACMAPNLGCTIRQIACRLVPPSGATASRLAIASDAAHLYELLDIDGDVEVLGRWSNRFAIGRAAISSRKVGKGRAVYVGTYLTESLVEGQAGQLFAPGDILPLVEDLPAGVEVTLREAPNRKLLFVLNTECVDVELSSLPSGADLLTGKSIDGSLSRGPHGCALIRY